MTGKAMGATIDGMRGEVVNHMAKKEILDKLSIYIPQKKLEERPVERLVVRGEKRDRSLVVKAIPQYLERETCPSLSILLAL